MTIALWCIFIAATLPYVPFSYVKGLDPIQPRHHVGDLVERSLRAYGAHLNGLETFPWFAAAVIVSHMVGGPSRIADILAVCPLYSGSDWPHDGLHRRPPASAHCCLRAVGRARNLHHAAVFADDAGDLASPLTATPVAKKHSRCGLPTGARSSPSPATFNAKPPPPDPSGP